MISRESLLPYRIIIHPCTADWYYINSLVLQINKLQQKLTGHPLHGFVALNWKLSAVILSLFICLLIFLLLSKAMLKF